MWNNEFQLKKAPAEFNNIKKIFQRDLKKFKRWETANEEYIKNKRDMILNLSELNPSNPITKKNLNKLFDMHDLRCTMLNCYYYTYKDLTRSRLGKISLELEGHNSYIKRKLIGLDFDLISAYYLYLTSEKHELLSLINEIRGINLPELSPFYGKPLSETTDDVVPVYFLNLSMYLFGEINSSLALVKLWTQFQSDWENALGSLKDIYENRKGIFNSFVNQPSNDLNHPLNKVKKQLNVEDCIELLKYKLIVYKETIWNLQKEQRKENELISSESPETKIMPHGYYGTQERLRRPIKTMKKPSLDYYDVVK